MSSSNKSKDIDYYELLGIDFEAEQAAIRKAYRKKALDCHPDKNPDNPKAAELFHQLSKALEVLTDEKAKAAYDKVLKARLAAKLRFKQLDAKRLKLKEDLDRREHEAFLQRESSKNYSVIGKSDEDILRDELERLRKEGSRLLEEEQKIMREKLLSTIKNQHHTTAPPKVDTAKHRLKIKWNAKKDDKTNGGYTQEKLVNLLKKFGDVEAIVLSKKPGSAIVEFKTYEASEMALKYEKGLIENPLQLQWVQQPQEKDQEISKTSTTTSTDFEDLVMRKLRQAEERKRLIAQIQKEEEEEND